MNKLTGNHIAVSELDRQSYICDLVHFDGPLVSLFKGQHTSWIHLWCDTDGDRTDRWLVFPVSRKSLVEYLGKEVTLLAVFERAEAVIAVDKKAYIESGDTTPTVYRSARLVNKELLTEYLPSDDSFFDESLTRDISLTEQLAPSVFDVPVDGHWFMSDIAKFSNSYTRLYAFFYCTGPRFVTNLQDRIRRYMHSPWKGGYSRVNLFEAMNRQIPAIHEMKVASYQYASPGDIKIEALSSVGDGIKQAVLAYVAARDGIIEDQRAIDTIIGRASLRKTNLSHASDDRLRESISEESLLALQQRMDAIADVLVLRSEFSLLRESAPNSVVAAKAVLAFMKQISIVAEYQSRGMLDLNRTVVIPAASEAEF
jgi:hypothetical protein